MLYMLPWLRKALFDLPENKLSGLSLGLVHLFCKMKNHDVEAINAEMVLSKFTRILVHFNSDQQSANECLQRFVELFNSIDGLNLESFQFRGHLTHDKICSCCKSQTSTTDLLLPFSDVKIYFDKNFKDNFLNSFKSFLNETIIHDDLDCSTCNEKKKHEIKSIIDPNFLPTFLFTQIQRKFNLSTDVKIDDMLPIPVLFNPIKTLTYQEIFQIAEEGFDLKDLEKILRKEFEKSNGPVFRLIGGINHIGTLAGGHYTSFSLDSLKEGKITSKDDDDYFILEDPLEIFIRDGSIFSHIVKKFQDKKPLSSTDPYKEFFEFYERKATTTRYTFTILNDQIFIKKLRSSKFIEELFGNFFIFNDSTVESVSVPTVTWKARNDASQLVYRKWPIDSTIEVIQCQEYLMRTISEEQSAIDLKIKSITSQIAVYELNCKYLDPENVNQIKVSSLNSSDILSSIRNIFQIDSWVILDVYIVYKDDKFSSKSIQILKSNVFQVNVVSYEASTGILLIAQTPIDDSFLDNELSKLKQELLTVYRVEGNGEEFIL